MIAPRSATPRLRRSAETPQSEAHRCGASTEVFV